MQSDFFCYVGRPEAEAVTVSCVVVVCGEIYGERYFNALYFLLHLFLYNGKIMIRAFTSSICKHLGERLVGISGFSVISDQWTCSVTIPQCSVRGLGSL